ncbi:hypothetical protein Osc7112_0701 [Oscillatoria nigro-viridis PCC 7112]|uniref:Uncharacterized protein n=1 Tax=Phormidium nigroviride PCC 7112 TaxID=179408 RepID=K9VBN2_9CYAN|nr:hypothetical protein Osc7112_0701 [Oscillatoria nigro-viridis PCC 7112]
MNSRRGEFYKQSVPLTHNLINPLAPNGKSRSTSIKPALNHRRIALIADDRTYGYNYIGKCDRVNCSTC